MIIKELIDLGKATTRRLKELERSYEPDRDEIEFLRHKLSALRELQDYVLSGEWTRETSRKKFAALMKSKFDYELTAKRFNTTRASLNVFAARQDKRLERIIGEAISLIEQDRIDEGVKSFYFQSGVFSINEFDYKPLDMLPDASEKDSFMVSDCADEVRILRSLMKSELQNRLDSTDIDKLSYLVFLLNTKEEAFLRQRGELIDKLRKKDS